MGDAGSKTRRKRKVKHRFYVPPSRFRFPEDGSAPTVEIGADTTHHIRNVLRLQEGSEIVLFNNSGKEFEGELVECRPEWSRVRISRITTPRTESPVRITLAQSIIKGNAFDRVLTLCTELGCARFIPLFTARTVVKLSKADAADRSKRWERIVQEASAQCGRVKVPYMEMPLDFKDLLEKKSDEDAGIILWERGGAGQLRGIVEDAGKVESVLLLAGPEGGFEQAEVKMAMDAGFKIWGLGPRILRAETAGATAISLLQHALGDMG